MIKKQLAEQRDKLAEEADDFYWAGTPKDSIDLYRKGFDAAVPLAFAERDRMIFDILKRSNYYEDAEIWLEEELKKRDADANK